MNPQYSECKLSVLVITYNHEAYISQAIESFLMQKTNFPIEVVIGDDCSTDQTRNICLEYQKKYPEIIRLLNRDTNIGVVRNFIDTFQRCKGKYIAICDGDDYWTDPLKLQKQVDFLETHSDYSACFHRVQIFNENSGEKSLSNQEQKETSDFNDLAQGNFIQTLSCIFRNNLFSDFPEWFTSSPIPDYALNLINAQHGKIKFFEDVMGVYRINDGGTWGKNSAKYRVLNTLNVVNNCREFFYPKGSEQFDRQTYNLLTKLCYILLESKNFSDFRKFYLKYLKYLKFSMPKQFLFLTKEYLLSFTKNASNEA